MLDFFKIRFLKKGFIVCILCLFASYILYGCQKLELFRYDVDFSACSEQKAIGLANMIKKAEYISNFEWSPESDLVRGRASYIANNTYYGIPYSSVKEIDTNVGLEVSFYTFVTAVNNPRSVLYTENITELPYHGTNCSVYYGTVCSTSVEYALGLDIPYATSMFDTLSCMKKKKYNTPDCVEIGDVLLSKGHVVLVTYVSTNNANEVQEVHILESSSVGSNARIRRYDYEAFAERWQSIGWISYFFNDYENNDLGIDECCSYSVQKLVCPNKGDKSCYRTSDTVRVNILSDKVKQIVIYKDGTEYCQMPLSNCEDIELSDYPFGYFRAVAADDNGNIIDECYFDIIETTVSVDCIGDNLSVTFNSSNAVPYYVCLCDVHGNRYSLDLISKDEVAAGSKNMSIPSKSGLYCKVLFKDKFGQISNIPIKIK